MQPAVTILLVHDNPSRLRHLRDTARAVLGAQVQIEVAEDGGCGRVALGRLPLGSVSVVVTDLELPEVKERGNASNVVGRELAQQAAELAESGGSRRLVIQYTTTKAAYCAAGTPSVPVYREDTLRGDEDLFRRIRRWLEDGTGWENAERGAWSPGQRRFVRDIHAARHDVIGPFLAIDADLQTLADLANAKPADGELPQEDLARLDDVTRALGANAANAPQAAEAAWSRLGELKDPEGVDVRMSVERDDGAKDALAKARRYLDQLLQQLQELAKVPDWNAGWEVVAQSGPGRFQRLLYGLGDELAIVVQYFEERYGRRAMPSE